VVKLIKRFVAEEEGLELLEYAILAAVLALALITVYGALGNSVSTALTNAAQALDDVSSPSSSN